MNPASAATPDQNPVRPSAKIIKLFADAGEELAGLIDEDGPEREPALDDQPTEYINDAEVWGVMSDEVANLPIVLSTAGSSTVKEWMTHPEKPLSQLFQTVFSKHVVGKKDGNSIVTGSLGQKSKRRTKSNVLANYMMGLDVDSGASMEDTFQKVRRMNLTAIFYTTHSHGTTGVEIAYDKFHRWCLKEEFPTEPTTDMVRRYMRDQTNYVTDVCDSAEFVEKRHEDGMKLIVRTRPIDKFRIIFPLAAPYVYADQPGAHKDVISAWESKVLGMGRSLGIEIDRTARDPSRLFYLPRHGKGADNWRIMLTCGRLLKFEDVQSASTSTRVTDDPFDQAAHIMGGTGRGRIMSPTLGLDMGQWAKDHAHHFDIASLFRDHCDDRIRVTQTTDKLTVECPFDDDHSNPGDPEDPGCFIQSAGMEAEAFAFHCQHAGCAGRSRLDFLNKAMQEGWFPDDALVDKAYFVDDEDEEDGEPDEEDKDPVRLLGFKALVDRGLEDMARDGCISASTKDALINYVAAGNAPSNAVEFLKAKLGIGVTQFQKDVAKRAKKLASEVGFNPDAIVKRIRQQPAFRNEVRPIVPIHSEHEVRTLRHFLSSLEKANVGDASESIEPGHMLFDFGGRGVRVGKNRNGRRRIDDLDHHTLVNAATDLLCVVKVQDDGAAEVLLPKEIAIQAAIDPKLPVLPLKRFVQHPLFTKDDSLLLKSGYDPKAQSFADLDGCDLSRIDMSKPVTEADVKKSVAALDLAFGDFRWAPYSDDENATGDASRAAFYALLLTPLVWEMIDGPVMMFGISKPDAGSGGTLLIQAAHTIWTGNAPDLYNWPKSSDDIELEKLLISILMDGRGAIIFDNVHGKVESSALPKAVTGNVSGRVLGGNKMFDGGVHYPVVLVGNGLAYSDENARRVVPIHIKPNDVATDAEGNKLFKVPNLLAYLTERRSEFLAHLITIVRWWRQQEPRPKTARCVDSFEDYASTMGGILQAAGIKGWLEGWRAFIADSQGDKSDETGILKAFADKFGLDTEFPPEKAKDVLFERDEDGPTYAPYETRFDRLRWCIKNGAVSSTNLGKALGYLRGMERTIDYEGTPTKVELKRRRSNGTNLWRVVRVAAK